ncbi:hypothetical protein KKG90_09100 [Candidatus Bipolaricaulota bacterium]|nr:hypothetical protein [Candidatus Bipolaricaulota bacterium]
MFRSLPNSRWKHLVRLIPLGAIVGLVVGYFFHDILFGLAIGCIFGMLLGLMFAVRNAQ